LVLAQPSPARLSQRLEVDATLYEAIRRATTRLLEAMLKWVGVTLILVSCALLVYLGAVLLTRLSAEALFP
jgi:hypothetical protein